jgi:TolB protein
MDTGAAKPPWRITDEEPGVDASQPTFSSDGQWIAYTVGYADGGGRDIYRIRADDSGERERLTEDGSNSDPAYSPDGGQIVFSSWRDHDAEIYAMAADGDGEHNLTEFRTVTTRNLRSRPMAGGSRSPATGTTTPATT